MSAKGSLEIACGSLANSAALRFPICETSIPPPVPGDPMNWGTATSHEFRIRICIDHVDDIFFQ